ncbi:MAG: hypothetical protein K8S27_08685 [Candidatus Omnitrophica bacterium]|nr:hypothetical protein [Candidatus Omnitrophota bacterium]
MKINQQKDKVFYRIFTLFFVFNVFLFLYICARPLTWSNKEILSHGFYWSMNGLDDLSVSAGLKKTDFVKVFCSTFVDGIFRPRQISYLVEMLSFKFWQQFGLVLTRNYTVLFLHISNVILVGLIINALAGDRLLAGLGAIGFLNAGAALATLQYPFRNAKVLVMFFFLLAVKILLHKNEREHALRWGKIFALGLLIILFMFTDETALFLWPFFLVCFVFRYGFKPLKDKKIFLGTGSTLVSVAALFFLFFYLSKAVSLNSLKLSPQQHYLSQLKFYWMDPHTYGDVFNGFIFYFLRRNFGYWDASFSGGLALVSFLMLLTILWHGRKAKAAKLCLALAVIFLVKTFCLPHDAGFHNTFMPKDTVFPSLLFFSYYYVYCEAVLFALMFGCLLSKEHLRNKYYFTALCLAVSIISLSNVLHVKDGPKDALAFMNYRSPYRQRMVKDVLAVRGVLGRNDAQKVFLSFPQPARDLVDGRLHQDELSLYVRMLPIKYLTLIDSGRIVVPVMNTRPRGFGEHQELNDIDCLYDVLEHDFYDMTTLKKIVDDSGWRPMINNNPSIMTRTRMINARDVDHIVLFLKGRGEFLIQSPGFKQSGIQTYGQSFQMFRYGDIDGALPGKRNAVSVHFIPTEDDQIVLVGPFIVYKDQTME